MEFNSIVSGLRFEGCSIKKLDVKNEIISITDDMNKAFGLEIGHVHFEKDEDYYGELLLEIRVEIIGSEGQKAIVILELEGGFSATEEMPEEHFKELVAVNGGAALYSIARSKIEAISSMVFSGGKILLPFVNIVEYYKQQAMKSKK